MNEGDRKQGEKKGKSPSDLLGSQGYTTLPGLSHVVNSGRVHIAMCSIPPRTPLNPLQLLWLALLLLVYWSTLGDKEEGPAWKGVPSPLPLSPSFILSSI